MKQQVICLVAMLCAAAHLIHAMENAVKGLPEHFKNLSYLGPDEEIDKDCLVAIMCAAAHLIHAREDVERCPEHFKNLLCPGLDEKIDKEALLNANPFWKQVSEHENQEKKNSYLQEALNLPCDDSEWMYHRNAIMCALATNADPDVTCWDDDFTALGETILMNDYPLVKFVLKCGANPNIRWYDEPLLFFAKSLKIAKLLIKYNANVLSCDNQNATVLHWAALDSRHSPDLIPFLVQQRCDVNAQDDEGHTPIMYAVDCGHRNIFNETKFRSLLEAGTDVAIKNDNGETIWDIAQKNGCLERARKIYDQLQ